MNRNHKHRKTHLLSEGEEIRGRGRHSLVPQVSGTVSTAGLPGVSSTDNYFTTLLSENTIYYYKIITNKIV